jgi:hypothetical protein
MLGVDSRHLSNLDDDDELDDDEDDEDDELDELDDEELPTAKLLVRRKCPSNAHK